MYHDKDSIKAAIRSGLPFCFGTNASVEFARFREKFDAVTQYARTLTGAFLTEPTLRYQSILLYSSLLWVGLHYFRLKEIDLLSQTLPVDDKVIAAFPLFTAAVACIFLFRVLLDYRARQIDLQPGALSVVDAKDYLQEGAYRTNIDGYFWARLFDEIGRAYAVYREAGDKAMEWSHDPSGIEMSSLYTDIDDLRKLEGLEPVIAERESFVREVSAVLEADIRAFEAEANEALAFYDASLVHEYDGREDRFSLNWKRERMISRSYDAILKKWLDARNELTDDQLDVALRTSQITRADLLLSTLRRARRIRLAMIGMEAAFPLVFAALVQAIYWTDVLALIQSRP